jgi:N-acetylneuraminic acid mutarotase
MPALLADALSLLDRGRESLSKLAAAAKPNDPSSPVRQLPRAGTVPPPRESHSITAIGAKLYVFGGFDGARVLNDLYVFDTHAGLWSQLVHTGISPAARAGHSATALGTPAHLVVFGGANSSRRFADVQLFDTADSHWQKPAVRGRPPAPRYYHCACLARGSLLIFGGSDGSACLADLHALNTESWAWSQPVTSGQPPPPRCGHTGTLVNKLLFVVGGAGDAHGEHADLHILDTESWSWWRPDVSPQLPPIAYHSAALTADKIFLFGGSTRDALYNDLLMLDTSTCEWQVRARAPAPARPHQRPR